MPPQASTLDPLRSHGGPCRFENTELVGAPSRCRACGADQGGEHQLLRCQSPFEQGWHDELGCRFTVKRYKVPQLSQQREKKKLLIFLRILFSEKLPKK